MRTTLVICATLIVLAVIGQTRADEGCENGDTYSCTMKCYFNEGRHGECVSGNCVCSTCIYSGCKAVCRKQRNRIAQCNGNECICMR